MTERDPDTGLPAAGFDVCERLLQVDIGSRVGVSYVVSHYSPSLSQRAASFA
jgi:hypothetical protein